MDSKAFRNRLAWHFAVAGHYMMPMLSAAGDIEISNRRNDGEPAGVAALPRTPASHPERLDMSEPSDQERELWSRLGYRLPPHRA